ncbi:MAG: hypothetical protein EON93_03230 [Burkholderiales bacterium]|nr:MAG: hypothetical protein EON93_03230 [Burkholderiales bacterium]
MTFRDFAKTLGIPSFVIAIVAIVDPMAAAQQPQQQPAKPAVTKQAAPAQAAPRGPGVAELTQQLADTQDQLARQTRIAENARLEVEKVRAEMKLKDELLALGSQRNAELYGIASEVAGKGLSNNGLEPFVQGQRVQMENLRQDYEDRLRAARIYPETLPPSVEQKMKEELAAEKPAAS